MRVAILGFGLIGGGLARALAAAGGDWRVVAWSPSGEGPRAAATDDLIAAVGATPEEAIVGSDIVVLAAPPLACLDLLDGLAGPWRAALEAGAVVTDVASTKRRIVERAAGHGLPFVGGHPMAGRETSGYAASTADLFVDRPWIVCPPPAPGTATDRAAVERVESIARAVAARPVRMTPEEHDAAVAAISHLPLVVSAALVEAMAGDRTIGWEVAAPLAASGWRDMIRLARGDVEMGTGILATNADEIAARLRVLRDTIDDWLAALDGPEPDIDGLRRRLTEARRLGEATR